MHPAFSTVKPRVNVLATILIFAVALIFVFPVYWTVCTSFKQPLDILTPQPKILFSPTLENYTYLRESSDFGRYLLNSLVVSVSSTALVCVLGFWLRTRLLDIMLVVASWRFLSSPRECSPLLLL